MKEAEMQVYSWHYLSIRKKLFIQIITYIKSKTMCSHLITYLILAWFILNLTTLCIHSIIYLILAWFSSSLNMRNTWRLSLALASRNPFSQLRRTMVSAVSRGTARSSSRSLLLPTITIGTAFFLVLMITSLKWRTYNKYYFSDMWFQG